MHYFQSGALDYVTSEITVWSRDRIDYRRVCLETVSVPIPKKELVYKLLNVGGGDFWGT